MNSYLVSLIFDTSKLENQIAGWTTLIILIAFFFVTIRQGVGSGLGAFVIAVAFAGAGSVTLTGAFSGYFTKAFAGAFAKIGIGGGIAFIGTVAGALAGAGTLTGALAGAGAFAGAGTLALVLALAAALTVALILALTFGFAFAFTFAGSGVLLSIYIGWQAIKGDEKYTLVRNMAVIFADGDFADFIKPIFDTLDLYHNQGVDPRAIAIALKNLAENHPEAELEIVAMEKTRR